MLKQFNHLNICDGTIHHSLSELASIGVLVKYAKTHEDPRRPPNQKVIPSVDRARRADSTKTHEDPKWFNIRVISNKYYFFQPTKTHEDPRRPTKTQKVNTKTHIFYQLVARLELGTYLKYQTFLCYSKKNRRDVSSQ